MNIHQAILIFDSLSQETRLSAFRLLVKAGPEGLAAGVIGSRLEIAHNTLSFHLSQLLNSGIVASRKKGRSIFYSANFEAVTGLIGFLVKDCCSPEFASLHEDSVSGGSIIELASCCQPQSKSFAKKNQSKPMKRLHIHVGVESLEKSIQFYSVLFGEQPAKTKSDYAKWMLEDPRINFAISTRAASKGVDPPGFSG